MVNVVVVVACCCWYYKVSVVKDDRIGVSHVVFVSGGGGKGEVSGFFLKHLKTT